MSKAFTREDDSEDLPPVRPLPTLPAGVKNYITREGADQLRRELERFQQHRSAPGSDRAQFDQRIAQLQGILASVTIVEPSPSDDCHQVRFGCSVTIDDNGEMDTYRIVGIHEIDLDRNYISWQSPLARALLNARVGDMVEFKAPAGTRRLKVLSTGT
jgi:transcription elongation factor GreB